MIMTIRPDTSGGKNRLTRLNCHPISTSTNAAMTIAPKTASRPYWLPMAIAAPTNAKLVPITTGKRDPTGPIGNTCTSVASPENTSTI